MRIAVLLKDRCKSKNCGKECIKFCPRVRAGDETIVMGENGIPIISEELCVGCGICVHKCPFDAIKIIGLAEELNTDLIHQFGKNGFRLFRLPIPKQGLCIGILGPNGIGKTTAVKILSGNLKPNLGQYKRDVSWTEILEYFAGTELQQHFKKIVNGEIQSVVKPQYVDKLPRVMKGEIGEILKKADTSGNFDEIVEKLGLKNILKKDIGRGKISGGELQLVAIAAAFLKDVDLYFFDEPSSYLDIHQRLKVARLIRGLAEKKKVVIVDAADMGLDAGEMRIIPKDRIGLAGFSTHSLPLSIFIKHIQETKGVDVILIGIQPEQFYSGISEKVMEAGKSLLEILRRGSFEEIEVL